MATHGNPTDLDTVVSFLFTVYREVIRFWYFGIKRNIKISFAGIPKEFWGTEKAVSQILVGPDLPKTEALRMKITDEAFADAKHSAVLIQLSVQIQQWRCRFHCTISNPGASKQCHNDVFASIAFLISQQADSELLDSWTIGNLGSITLMFEWHRVRIFAQGTQIPRTGKVVDCFGVLFWFQCIAYIIYLYRVL